MKVEVHRKMMEKMHVYRGEEWLGKRINYMWKYQPNLKRMMFLSSMTKWI